MFSIEKSAATLSLVVVTVVLLTGCSGEDPVVTAPTKSAEAPVVAESSVANSSVQPSEAIAPVVQSGGESERDSDPDVAVARPTVETISNLPVAVVSNARHMADVAEDLSHLDPRKDGWVTEVINEAVGQRFTELKGILKQAGVIDPAALEPLVASVFQCGPLVPVDATAVFEEGSLSVARVKSGSEIEGAMRQGAEGFAASLAELVRPAGAGEHPHVEPSFKVVGVTADRQQSTTRVLAEIMVSNDGSRVQRNATWDCVWQPSPNRGGLPVLAEIRTVTYEEVTLEENGEPLFVDGTEAILGETAVYREQLLYGLDYWRQRLDWRFTQAVTGPHGLALGDVNGDDRDDLFYCETGGLPNRLFLQLPDGTLRDFSAEAGLDYLEPASSALLIDLDNDGDQDLAMNSGRNLLFFANDGSGHFTRKEIRSSDSVARSMTAVDYDGDGLLDLYVCGYFSITGDGTGIGRPLPYHDANNGVKNYLLKNRGDWDFEDVTASVGLDQNNQRFSYAAAWEDYDNDGDQDLYVANDFGRNNLYRNDGGQFVDVAAQAGVEDLSAGMSVSWGDYNRDGWPDLYVGNMYSSAGNRVAYQRRYRGDESEETKEMFQRHARGNSLFLNSGDGRFRDVSLDAGVTMGRWAWGSNFVDVNNDGWDDLIVGNGLVTSPDDTGDL